MTRASSPRHCKQPASTSPARRDPDGEALRGALRDFLDKAQASGPDTVAFVYLSGYGVQLDGDNYFVPVDAKIAADQDVAIEALRVSDYTKRLAGLP